QRAWQNLQELQPFLCVPGPSRNRGRIKHPGNPGSGSFGNLLKGRGNCRRRGGRKTGPKHPFVDRNLLVRASVSLKQFPPDKRQSLFGRNAPKGEVLEIRHQKSIEDRAAERFLHLPDKECSLYVRNARSSILWIATRKIDMQNLVARLKFG